MSASRQLTDERDELYGRQIEWPVLPTEASVKEVRDRVPEELRAWGFRIGGENEFEIKLIVSELVTNALVHAPRHDIHFAMWIHKPGQLVVEVQDRGARAPSRARRLAARDETSGRGMDLVEALALGWGVRYPGAGKCVYATIAIPDTPQSG